MVRRTSLRSLRHRPRSISLPVRVLAAPKEEHLPRLLVIHRFCLQIGLRLVGRMESEEGGPPPVVAEREAIRAARRRASAGEPQRMAAQPGRERRVGSRVPPDPWRQIAYGLNLSPIWCSRLGVGFGREVSTQKREPGLITVKWAAAVVGRIAAATSHRDCYSGDQAFRHRPVTMPCVVSRATTPHGPLRARHRDCPHVLRGPGQACPGVPRRRPVLDCQPHPRRSSTRRYRVARTHPT